MEDLMASNPLEGADDVYRELWIKMISNYINFINSKQNIRPLKFISLVLE